MASAAFAELDWRRIDVWAIVACSGITVIEQGQLEACRLWLQKQKYEIVSLDCSEGLKHTIRELGRLFDWERQFGYVLDGGRCNLDALRDGFELSITAERGCVLEVIRPDIVWQEDPDWLLGLLSIAQEYSRKQLAVGRRFFALLVIPRGSPLIGQTIEKNVVPCAFSNPCREVREFLV